VTRSYFLEYRINDRTLKSGTSTSKTVNNIVNFETGPTIAAFYAGPENKEFLGYVNEKRVEGTDRPATRVRPKADPSTVSEGSGTGESVSDGVTSEESPSDGVTSDESGVDLPSPSVEE
jgi:hypothetical protein